MDGHKQIGTVTGQIETEIDCHEDVETQNRDHLDQHRKRRRKMRANVISEILHAEKKYLRAPPSISYTFKETTEITF